MNLVQFLKIVQIEKNSEDVKMKRTIINGKSRLMHLKNILAIGVMAHLTDSSKKSKKVLYKMISSISSIKWNIARFLGFTILFLYGIQYFLLG